MGRLSWSCRNVILEENCRARNAAALKAGKTHEGSTNAKYETYAVRIQENARRRNTKDADDGEVRKTQTGKSKPSLRGEDRTTS